MQARRLIVVVALEVVTLVEVLGVVRVLVALVEGHIIGEVIPSIVIGEVSNFLRIGGSLNASVGKGAGDSIFVSGDAALDQEAPSGGSLTVVGSVNLTLGNGAGDNLRRRADITAKVMLAEPDRIKAQLLGVIHFLEKVLVVLLFRAILSIVIE